MALIIPAANSSSVSLPDAGARRSRAETVLKLAGEDACATVSTYGKALPAKYHPGGDGSG
jgi:hypothetical protein